MSETENTPSNPSHLVLNRNFTLNTLKGHSVKFEKDVPIYVPRAIWPEAFSVGAVLSDGGSINPVVEVDVDKPPNDPVERNPLILAAIEKLVKDGEREDFTAAGSPTVDAVTRTLGFKVQAKEIAGVWQTYHEKVQAEKDGE